MAGRAVGLGATLRARAVRLAPPRGGVREGATGTRVPLGSPGAGFPPAPADPAGPAREPLAGLSGTREGSPGPPCGARVAAISVPVRSSACRLRSVAGASRLPSSHWAADGSPPLLALLPSAGFPGLLDLEPPNTGALLPGAGRCHAGCWYLRPVASSDTLNMEPPGAAGICRDRFLHDLQSTLTPPRRRQTLRV